jgi:hypothetical protein
MTGVPVHTWFVPGGKDSVTLEDLPDTPVEHLRWMNGVDVVSVYGRLLDPRQADEVGRRLCQVAALAAAHNAGAVAP